MSNTAKIIIYEYCVPYFVAQVKSKLLTQAQGKEQLYKLLNEITDENSSEADTESKIDAFMDYTSK